MTKKQKKTLYRIIAAAVLLVAAAVVCELAALPWWAQLVLHLAPYLVIGYDVLWRAMRRYGASYSIEPCRKYGAACRAR